MARHHDSPQDQKSKGYPGKRRTKVDRAIAEAARLSEMLAASPLQGAEPLAPPAYIRDPRLQPAFKVWLDYAPELARSHLLADLDRHTFAIFCVYMGEFVTANEEILNKGYAVAVKTISGDKMLRENPAVSRRDVAVKVVLELSKRFGLTPLDRYGLMKEQYLVRDQLGGGTEDDLVSRARRNEGAAPTASAAEAEVIGILNRFDSEPPPGQLN